MKSVMPKGVEHSKKLFALPEFGNVEPTLRTYLHSLRDYRKNMFPELTSDVRRRIAGEWGKCFEEWGYPV